MSAGVIAPPRPRTPRISRMGGEISKKCRRVFVSPPLRLARQRGHLPDISASRSDADCSMDDSNDLLEPIQAPEVSPNAPSRHNLRYRRIVHQSHVSDEREALKRSKLSRKLSKLPSSRPLSHPDSQDHTFPLSTTPARWIRSVHASPGRSLRQAANCFALGSAAYVLRYSVFAEATTFSPSEWPAPHGDPSSIARDVIDLASASLYTLGSTLWLHQTMLRERLSVDTAIDDSIDDSMDEQSAALEKNSPTWDEFSTLFSKHPVVTSVVLFLCGCALDDVISLSDVIAEEVATTRGADPSPASFMPGGRVSFERLLPFAPGLVGAVTFGASGAARLARFIRGDLSHDEPRDEADMWLPCERDECSAMTPPPENTARVDGRVARVAAFVQLPLNVLVSFTFIDGAWLELGAFSKLGAQPAYAAPVGNDIINVASSLSESAAKLASENYVVGNSLADLGSIRDDLFSAAADGGASGSTNTAEFMSSSNAAHVVGGSLFLLSSIAWIVELRAQRRLRCARRLDEADEDLFG